MRLKLTQDKIICRLRWVAASVILLDGGCTLLGQPLEFWSDPRYASEYNSFVRLFLVQGWQVFTIMGLLYTIAAISIASIVPRRAGLLILFTLLLCHFSGASTWMIWYFGFTELQSDLVGMCIAILVTVAIGEAKQAKDKAAESEYQAKRREILS